MFLPQLLNTFFFSGGYGAYEAASGVMGESAYGIGAALILGALAFIYYLVVYYRKKEYDVMTGTGKMMFGMGILSLFMASVYFPWDRLQKTSSLMGKVIATIQFPNRFVELSILFFTIVACVAAVILYQNRRKWALPLYMGILAGVMLISTTFLVDNMMYNMTAFHIYDADCMGNGYVAGGEYVLLDTDVEALKAGTYAADAGTTISGCSKKYCNVTVICSNAGAAEGYVEVPLLYYKGYQAAVLGTGQQLTITPGDNNVLRVSVPAGFNGTIQIGFHTLWYWRIAELISLAALVFLVVCACRNRKKSDGEIA